MRVILYRGTQSVGLALKWVPFITLITIAMIWFLQTLKLVRPSQPATITARKGASYRLITAWFCRVVKILWLARQLAHPHPMLTWCKIILCLVVKQLRRNITEIWALGILVIWMIKEEINKNRIWMRSSELRKKWASTVKASWTSVSHTTRATTAQQSSWKRR